MYKTRTEEKKMGKPKDKTIPTIPTYKIQTVDKKKRVRTKICHINSSHPVYNVHTYIFREVLWANETEKPRLNFLWKCEEKKKQQQEY